MTTIAKSGTSKYRAQVWAGLIEDHVALAEERARRDREREARRQRNAPSHVHPASSIDETPERG